MLSHHEGRTALTFLYFSILAPDASLLLRVLVALKVDGLRILKLDPLRRLGFETVDLGHRGGCRRWTRDDGGREEKGDATRRLR